MNDLDRAIVAAAEERDRRRSERGPRLGAAVRDRRELLRIVRDQKAELRAARKAWARHYYGRTVDEAGIGDSDRADADAAAEAEFLRPIGPGR